MTTSSDYQNICELALFARLVSATAMSTNLSVLTRSHQVAGAKRRQKREQIKEIVFDDEARLYAL